MGIDIFGVEAIMLTQQEEIKLQFTKYIQNQLQEDQLAEQISLKEYIDPFTGVQVKGSK